MTNNEVQILADAYNTLSQALIFALIPLESSHTAMTRDIKSLKRANDDGTFLKFLIDNFNENVSEFNEAASNSLFISYKLAQITDLYHKQMDKEQQRLYLKITKGDDFEEVKFEKIQDWYKKNKELQNILK